MGKGMECLALFLYPRTLVAHFYSYVLASYHYICFAKCLIVVANKGIVTKHVQNTLVKLVLQAISHCQSNLEYVHQVPFTAA